ncbi:hypothetical protein EYF80_010744 [Liparis tanakae]|uniref:Uncharacterized protein n=1 Tax=Liparis tanakae TaxID=230148 RepID=A0A4Z2IMI1_9TELE|nr:hypothetical protein EYF80_010744 [Liparis tanakae]
MAMRERSVRFSPTSVPPSNITTLDIPVLQQKLGNQAVCSIIYRPLENTAREKGGYFHCVWRGRAFSRLESGAGDPGRHFGRMENGNRDRHTDQGPQRY